MKTILIICISFIQCLIIKAGDIELGKVKWIRNLKEAQSTAIKLNKPVLILFQEVPGCSTCKNYGSKVLSHPLIVEAIETYFVPLCIHNNKGGTDREALDYFFEPSWNNPVVRIVDSNLKPIVERLDGNYSDYGLISKINASLIKMGITVPQYLKLLEEELKAYQTGLEHTTIGMYCFWAGEKTYGQINGVIATNAGYMNGSEVVDIYYNPKETNLNELVKTGKMNNSADKLFTENPTNLKAGIPSQKPGKFRMDTETKYYLSHTDYKYIPMTPLQATRANSYLADGKSCEHVFSPRQLDWLQKIKTSSGNQYKNQIGRDMITAWYEDDRSR